MSDDETAGAPRVSRRRLVAGGIAATVGGVGLLEYLNLKGTFDWRTLQPSTAAERYAAAIAQLDADRNAIVHVSHSTHLIAVGGVRMLTDPWFYDPSFGALTHEVPPAVSPEAIGRLDVILVTHRHADHFDPVAVDQLDKRALVVVNDAALAARVRALGFTAVEVLETWGELMVGDVKITATPALHDIPENGYVVTGDGHAVYFAGDTSLFDGIDRVAERLQPTCAIVPVDGTRLVGGKKWVMDPIDAVEAVRRLGVRTALPSHAEAYFSDPLAKYVLASTVAAAPRAFGDAMAAALPGVECVVPAPGQRVVL